MKNSLYIVAASLIVIWAVLFLGFHATGIVHMLLILAGFVFLVRVHFRKQLSG